MVLALAAIMLGSTTSVADHGWQRGGARDRQRRATPAPPPVVTPIAGLTMTAQPLLGGWARAGDWAAVRVRLENDGPAVEGELRVASAAPGSPSYAVAVHVPPGARQEHVLYGQAWVLRANLRVTLERSGSVLAMSEVSLKTSLDEDVLATFLVAERPERLLDEVRSSILLGLGRKPPVVPIGPGDLPPRVEAWAPMDRLVWQDVSFSSLGLDQLDALRTWVGLGGSFTLLGGSTGITTLGAIPSDLLPYRPARVVDVAAGDLAGLLGDLSAGTSPVPAVAGELLRGTALAAGGGEVIAARMPYGLGSVTMVGIDPATLTDTAGARRLWTRLLPSTDVRTAHRVTTYGRDIRRALATLPTVSTPERDQVLALFLGYALLLGPVNYLVLRRMDRREWAWLTVPALVVAFTLVAYVLGVALKGTSVVVNELAIVHGAAGADRGIAQAWVAVYTPVRASVDARVGGGALVTEAEEPGDRPASERPLDVLHGDPSTVHALEIGHGGVRAFAAQASVSVPRLEAELVLNGDRLGGTVRNLSDVRLEHVAVVYGRGVRRLGDLAPGQAGTVSVAPPRNRDRRSAGARQLLDLRAGAKDAEAAATLRTRSAMVRSLLRSASWDDALRAQDAFGSGAVIVAWRADAPLAVDAGPGARHLAQTMYVLPVRIGVAGSVTFTGPAMARSIVDVRAFDANVGPVSLGVDRGTMTVEYHPAGFDGTLRATGLTVLLGDHRAVAGPDGPVLMPLPMGEQPDQAEPAGTAPTSPSGPPSEQLPRIQLYERLASRWVEFEALQRSNLPDRQSRAVLRHLGKPARPVRRSDLNGVRGIHVPRPPRRGRPVTAALVANGFRKRYGLTVVIPGIDLTVERGAVFGLVGRNGAGKTTFLRMLATALPASGGDALICDYSVRWEPARVRRVIGYMPDTFGVYDDMRAWEYLDFFARCQGLPPSARRRVVGDLLDLVDLAHKRNAYVHTLSRGMQQRLCLAHALVNDPEVLLLDEPASGLDPVARTELRELLRTLGSMGKTLVISSHVLSDLEELCTGIAIVDRGRVVASGPIGEILGHRQGAVLRARIVGDQDAVSAAAAYLATQPEVASVEIRNDGRLELAMPTDEAVIAELVSRTTGAGHRVAALVPVATDLEELFFQLVDPSGMEVSG
jgi:ABC-2 type transport system ATP-binding protein